jgi:hypothetical protein
MMTALTQVGADYVHCAKRAVPQDPLDLGGGVLKFYHVEKRGEAVPGAVAAAARALLAREAGERLGLDGDCGFVILHRCGADFFFLLVTLWRGNNEAWEAVWYRQGDMADFAPFDPAYPPAAGPPRPTFCVWELGVVAHEAAAWSRFLASPRTGTDLARWRADLFGGAV